jgi:hypothetical protein
MTTLIGEDPALPEKTENEAWYDAEITPALTELAARCHARGMSFLASVEYQPDDRAGTYYMTESAGTAMRMLYLCARTMPNIDRYVFALRQLAEDRDMDTSSSMVLTRLNRETL